MRTSSIRKALLLVSLLVIPYLAGCLHETDPGTDPGQEAVFRVDGRLVCDVEVISNCDELAADPDAPVVVTPFQIESRHPERAVASDYDSARAELRQEGHIGLLITHVERDVIVRDISIMGYEVGVMVREVDCASCAITFENVTIEETFRTIGTGEGDAVYSEATGFRIENVTADVQIHGAHLRLPGGGSYFFLPEGPVLRSFPSAHGVWVEQYSGRFEITGLHLMGENQTGGWGVLIRGPGTEFSLADSTIENFYTCLSTRVASVEVKNVSLDACAMGARFSGPTIDEEPQSTSVERLDVQDADWFGFIVETSDYTVCQGPPDPGHLDAMSRFKMVDSHVANAGLVGMLALYSSVAVERSRFIGNGHNFQEGESPTDEINTGGMRNRCGIATVHDSIFMDNRIFGYKGHHWDDATNNWWGSPLGPSLQDELLLLPQATGDAINPEVRYAPFLVEEPDL